MKVYVCFNYYGDYEGYSEPEEVFLKEDKAEAWVEENKHYGMYYEMDVVE